MTVNTSDFATQTKLDEVCAMKSFLTKSKRSIIESQNIGEQAGYEVIGIIRRLIESRTK